MSKCRAQGELFLQSILVPIWMLCTPVQSAEERRQDPFAKVNLEELLRTTLSDEDKDNLAVAVVLAMQELHDKFLISNDISIQFIDGKTMAKFRYAHAINNSMCNVFGSDGYREPQHGRTQIARSTTGFASL